ncbi:MAG TPA: carboxypeptidase regulatory-like domain-containing protein [Polyangiaceae bacterium]
MEEARLAHGFAKVTRAHIVVWLLVAVILLALGTVTDSPLHAVAVESAPPPVPATVTDRDASVVATTHDEHGEIVAGARVSVLSEIEGRFYAAGGARTDAKGSARIANLPRGHAWILADAPGRARASSSVVLAGERTIDLVLGPEHTFVVNVVDEAGHGIPNAEIEVSGAEPLPYGARTDAQGRAEVGRLGEPPWVVTARATGWDETTARSVRDGAAIKLVLHRLGSILVHVVDPSEKPVQNARVRIGGASLWPAREGRTGPHGAVKLAGLFAGSYALRATEGTRASPIEIGVMLGAGEDKELTLHLAPGRMVVAHVTDGDAEDAEDIAGARVVLAESGLSPFPIEAVTDKHGRAVLGPIASGSATLSARAEGYVGRAAVNVPEPLTGEVRVVLARAGVLTGRVVDARGFPIGGATIEIVGTDFAGGPIDDEPRSTGFREAEFTAALPGPAALVSAGELGVVPGPVPPIPRGDLPIPGTSAQASPRAEPWVTSSDGTFRASPATPGRVRALVRHPEYVEAWSELVTIPAGGEAHVEVVLRGGGSVEGRLVDARGDPVSGARIELLATHGTLQRDTRSASDGTFAFASVPHDVSLDVYETEDATAPALRATTTVADGERRELTLTLPAARDPVDVAVRDDRGYAVASAQVSMTSLDPSVPLRATVFSDADGAARLANARGLPIRVEITAPGHAPKHLSFDAAPASIDATLDRGASLTALVRSSRGDPVADAEVVLYMNSGVHHLRSDATGAVTASDLAPGAARLVVRAAGYATVQKTFTVPASDRPFDVGAIDLASEGTVEGDVVDARGDPVAGARVAKDRVPVFLAAGATPPDVATTDARGHFKLGGMASGTFALEAYAPEIGRGRAEGVRVDGGRATTNVRIALAAQGPAPADRAGATVAVTLGEAVEEGVREVVVVLVAEGSEAERSGLLAGDTITDVDGAPVHTIEDTREKLGGAPGTDVVLGIKRASGAMRIRVGREIVHR